MAGCELLKGTSPDKAEVAGLTEHFVPPPTAAEIDRRLQLELFEEIQQKLQSDVDGFFPNDEKTKYSNVYVLLICWANEEPKLPVSLELDELCNVFSSYYGFHTEKWKIPPDKPHNRLSQKILDFIELGGDSRRDLKIVYYAGHGMLTKGRQPVWANLSDRKNKAFQTVKWSGIQNTLEQAQSDVLILLDCCASGTANTDDGHGTTELIAACGFDAAANPVGAHSFTQALIRELIDLSREPCFTVSILYNNILSRLSNWMPDGPWSRRKSPLYVPLTQDPVLPRPIQLSPRLPWRLSTPKPIAPENDPASAHSSATQQSELVLHPNRISWRPLDSALSSVNDMPPLPWVSAPNLEGLTCFVLDIWIQKSLPLRDFPVERFGDWIRMMPILAEHVRVGPGSVDYCKLLEFIQSTLVGAICSNRLSSLQTVQNQISLTQETLKAANDIIDQMVEQRKEAKASAESLERTVSEGFASVAYEVRDHREKVVETAQRLNNTVATGFASVVEELNKQGQEVVASSERIERSVLTNFGETERKLDSMMSKVDEISSSLPVRRQFSRPSISRAESPMLSLSSALRWKRWKKNKKATAPERLPHHWLLQQLVGRDHVFLIDNSTSMGLHWDAMIELFGVLSYLVKDADPDGIEVYFTISDGRPIRAKNTTPLLDYLKKMAGTQASTTNINLGLNHILDGYKAKLHEQKIHKTILLRKAFKDVRPMNLYVLTDGRWRPPADASKPICSLVTELQELGLRQTQVGIQFIRFGEDLDALKRLEGLDDNLGLPMDIVDTEPWNGNIWKMLLGAVNETFDLPNPPSNPLHSSASPATM